MHCPLPYLNRFFFLLAAHKNRDMRKTARTTFEYIRTNLVVHESKQKLKIKKYKSANAVAGSACINICAHTYTIHIYTYI